MNGSAKQVKWAEEIKAGKASEFEAIRKAIKNEIGAKAVDYIDSNDSAAFWIDNRERKVPDMLNGLCRGGLAIKGNSNSAKALLDTTTGMITITWTEIVQDGKGGHMATKTQTI